jgi:hypothetical protein
VTGVRLPAGLVDGQAVVWATSDIWHFCVRRRLDHEAARGARVSSAEQTLSGDETMPRLEGYRFGRLVVNGEVQTRDVDVIVLPARVVTNSRLRTPTSSRPSRCPRVLPGALGRRY